MTVRRKVSVSSANTSGAMNMAMAWSEPLSRTVLPPVWRQAWLAMVPPGSLAVPARITTSPAVTDRSAPAPTKGGRLVLALSRTIDASPPPPVKRTIDMPAPASETSPHLFVNRTTFCTTRVPVALRVSIVTAPAKRQVRISTTLAAIGRTTVTPAFGNP